MDRAEQRGRRSVLIGCRCSKVGALRSDLLAQPLVPGLQAFAAAGRNLQHPAAGIDLQDVFLDPFHLNRQVGQQIDLGDQHAVSLAEHHWVLEGLVIAFGDAE